MFDFSEFFGGNNVRPIEFLGLTENQTRVLLDDQYGLSKTLMEHYPDVTKRAGGPNSVMKCLIVWESAGRDCYYSDLANALNISEDTAYQTMNKGKKWITNAFGINVEHAGERIFMVTNQTLAQKAERLEKHLDKVIRPLESFRSDVNSIRQSGQTPVLSGAAGALLAGYEQVKALEASND
jgi:hypothetical protein